jgi:hypothetical protein
MAIPLVLLLLLYVNLSKNLSLLHPNFSNAGAKIDIPFELPNILLKKVIKGVSP